MMHTNNSNNPAPDGGWGWVVVFAAFMIHLIISGITYSMGDLYLHSMMEVFHSTRSHISLIYGLLLFMTLATGPIVTIFVNRYGCRPITIAGACVAALGYLASSFYAKIWFYYVVIGIFGGIGFGMMYLPAVAVVGYYFEKKRSLAFGLSLCGSGLGTMAFSWLMPYVIGAPLWFDYDGALLFESAILFTCIISGILMRTIPTEHSEKRRIHQEARSSTEKHTVGVITTTNNAAHGSKSTDSLYSMIENTPLRECSAVSFIASSNHEQSYTRQGLHVSFSLENQDENSVQQSTVIKSIEKKASILIKRKDAAYQGDLHLRPLQNENVECHRQMMTTNDVQTGKTNTLVNEGNIIIKNQSFLRELADEIDIELFKNPAFLLFILSNFLSTFGLFVPCYFANDLAVDTNVSEQYRHWIIMSIGIGSSVGRVVIGYLGDVECINRLYLYSMSTIITGLTVLIAPYCGSIVYFHMAYALTFGIFSGGFISLTSVIITDLVGIDKLVSALGTLYLFQGLAAALGTPLVGMLRDLFSNFPRPYLWPYFIVGNILISSGTILFLTPLLKHKQEQRRHLTQQERDINVISYSNNEERS